MVQLSLNQIDNFSSFGTEPHNENSSTGEKARVACTWTFLSEKVSLDNVRGFRHERPDRTIKKPPLEKPPKEKLQDKINDNILRRDFETLNSAQNALRMPDV